MVADSSSPVHSSSTRGATGETGRSSQEQEFGAVASCSRAGNKRSRDMETDFEPQTPRAHQRTSISFAWQRQSQADKSDTPLSAANHSLASTPAAAASPKGPFDSPAAADLALPTCSNSVKAFKAALRQLAIGDACTLLLNQNSPVSSRGPSGVCLVPHLSPIKTPRPTEYFAESFAGCNC